MNNFMIFTLEVALVTVAALVLAQRVILPAIKNADTNKVLCVLLVISSFRFLAMNFTVDFLTSGLDAQWGKTAAITDVTVGLIALFAAMLVGKSKLGLKLAWLYLILGSIDFAIAVPYGYMTGMHNGAGTTWYILTIGVPIWIVTLYMLAITLKCAKSGDNCVFNKEETSEPSNPVEQS